MKRDECCFHVSESLFFPGLREGGEAVILKVAMLTKIILPCVFLLTAPLSSAATETVHERCEMIRDKYKVGWGAWDLVRERLIVRLVSLTDRIIPESPSIQAHPARQPYSCCLTS